MKFRRTFKVETVQNMGSDEMIARAARVSTGKDLLDQDKIEGLIGYLVRERHTSPLESCVVTFRIEAPIFVAREWMRHRTQSYNELSLRYTESDCEFYVPPADRPLVNDGSSAHPELVQGAEDQKQVAFSELKYVYRMAEDSYQHLLKSGIAREVARNVLPVSTYTAFYATANLNNWLKFLDLRNGDKGHPQWEIVQCAQMVQARLTELYPITMGAWRG